MSVLAILLSVLAVLVFSSIVVKIIGHKNLLKLYTYIYIICLKCVSSFN